MSHNLRPPTTMPNRQHRAAASASMLHVFETGEAIRDAEEAGEEAEEEGHAAGFL